MFPGYSSHLRFAVVLVAIIFTAAAARAEERKALPVDEAGKDAAFAGREDFRDFLTVSEDDLADEYKHEAASRRVGVIVVPK
jgi:hypothetical protein